MIEREKGQSHEVVEVLKHVPALDGLRGFAILLVLMLHLFWANDHTTSRLANLLITVIGSFGVGVDLFFVLSGFLITGILFDSIHDRHFFRNFYGRRVLRIFPLYYGVILLLFLIFPSGLAAGPRPLILLLLFLQNTPLWFHMNHAAPPTSLVTQLWSLAAEEQFYLVWPVVIFLVRDRRRLLWLTVAGILSAALVRDFLFSHGASNEMIYKMTICRADTLLIGAWLALAVRGPAREKILRWAPVVFWPALALWMPVALSIGPFTHQSWYAVHFSYSSIAFASGALIAMSLRRGSFAQSAMQMRWLRFLGKYSYGLYVLHEFPLLALQAPLRSFFSDRMASLVVYHLVFAILALAASIGIAWLSYQFYEKRFLRLKDHFNYQSPSVAPISSVAA